MTSRATRWEIALMLCGSLAGVAPQARADARCSLPRMPQTEVAGAAGDGSAAVKADADWTEFAAKSDAAGARKLLDADFEWTDAQGKTRRRAEAGADVAALLADNRGDSEVKTYSYDRLEVVSGVHHKAHFSRIWVKRAAGWRLFAAVDTPIASGTAPFAIASASGVDCQNPCKTMPYKPVTASDRTIAALFERLKVDEWHPNPEDWAPYVLDGVFYVTSSASLSKEDRVAHLAEMKKSGGASVPGDPVIFMRIFDFGKSAVMIATHAPYLGGKPYYSLRVWTYQDGRWQLANSQQTTIEGAPAVAGAAAKK